MKYRLKIWQFLLAVSTVIILLRFSLIIDGLKLITSFIELSLSSSEKISGFINFPLMDFIFSLFLILFMPIAVLIYWKKYKFLNYRLTFSITLLLILVFGAITAPIITNENPNFQKNLSVTRLLKPMSSVKVIYLNSSDKIEDKSLQKFIKLKQKVIKEEVNNEILFVDSIKTENDTIFVYQANKEIKFSAGKFKFKNGNVMTTDRLFILGTDELGRDIFTRIIYGSRLSILVGLLSVFISLFIGILFGFLAGYLGGYFDLILSRVTDMFLTIPSIFFVVLIIALFGNSILTLVVVLGFSGWMSLYKIVKGEVIYIKQKDYFKTSIKIGLSKFQLLTREIIPVIIIPVVVNVVLQFGNVILAEASLSYLGLGPGANYPSWGSMILSGQQYMSHGWWMIIIPGTVLILTLLSVNSIGEEIKKQFNPILNK